MVMRDNRNSRQELNRLFKEPKYRPWKYSAYTVIGLVLATQLLMLIFYDEISYRTRLFMEGCIGLCAIIFVILIAILYYKLYSDYYRNKYNRRN